MQKILFLFIFALAGCALFRENAGPPPSFGPREQVYNGAYDSIWRATQIVMQSYPLRVNNMDGGMIETESIRGFKGFTPPYEPNTTSAGLSYALTVRLVKGFVNDKDTVKVSILKSIELTPDFFSEPKRFPSDGMEEKMLLYRIHREMQIEKAMEKAQKKSLK